MNKKNFYYKMPCLILCCLKENNNTDLLATLYYIHSSGLGNLKTKLNFGILLCQQCFRFYNKQIKEGILQLKYILAAQHYWNNSVDSKLPENEG